MQVLALDQIMSVRSCTSKFSSFWAAAVHRSPKTSGICVQVLVMEQIVSVRSCASKLRSFRSAANDHREAEHSALFGEGAEPVA